MGNPFVFQLAKSVEARNGFMTKPIIHNRSFWKNETKLILTIPTPARHWACQVPCIPKNQIEQGF